MSIQPSIDLIRDVTESTFHSLVLEGEGPIVVEFMSYGCSHCRTIEAILQEAAEKLRSRVRFFRANIAVDKVLAERFGIHGTPTLIVFSNGQKIETVEGPDPKLSSLFALLGNAFQA